MYPDEHYAGHANNSAVDEWTATEEWVEEDWLQAVDWLALAESTEQLLRSFISTVISPDAVLRALQLRQLQCDAAAALLRLAHEEVQRQRPCRHALQGQCMRRDCFFFHDFANLPCRYWLYSYCASDNCPFVHDLPYGEVQTGVGSEIQSVPSAVEHFPAMTQKHGLPEPQSARVLSASQPARNEDVKQMIQRNFAMKSAKSMVRGSESYATMTAKKAAPPPDSRAVGVFGMSSSMAQVVNQFGLRELLLEKQLLASNGINEINGRDRRSVEAQRWVTSGSELREDYESLRAEARAHALARNRLLQEATMAYRNGARDTARTLSAEGQRMNHLMKQCHMQAAKALFRKRNSLEQLQQGYIDFHGLHVSEAIDCLLELVPIFRDAMRSRCLSLITGSGHHTLGTRSGQAKLYPALKDLCEKELGFSTSDIRDQHGFVSGLVVRM